jgi:fumarylpyruvate hydrolase
VTGFLFPRFSARPLAVRGATAAFPVNRIFCVGRNYAEHAREMGVEVDREKPFYFTKSPSAFVASPSRVPYPCGTANYHHEVELVVAIGAPAFRVGREAAGASIFGYACGLDMTRRDLQLAERARQRPWDLGKDVENSAVVARIARAAQFGAVANRAIRLHVNGVMRQEARLSDLVWSVEELVSHLSGFYHLAPGDLLFTGTPAGVGPVQPGDRVVGEIDGLDPVELEIGEAE